MGYSYKYKPQYCEKLVEFMSQGYSLSAFCSEIGVTREVAYQWFKEWPEFEEARRQGTLAAQKFWETLLISDATGVMPKALASRGSKGINSNSVMFTLRTRFFREYGTPETQSTTNVVLNNLNAVTEIDAKKIESILKDPELSSSAKLIAEKLSEE